MQDLEGGMLEVYFPLNSKKDEYKFSLKVLKLALFLVSLVRGGENIKTLKIRQVMIFVQFSCTES